MHLTEKDGLSGNLVMCIYEDSDSNFWFGTYGNGVNLYDGESFINYKKSNGLCSNVIYCIMEDKSGNMWFV